MVFGYTSCPDVCPTTLLAVHRALLALGEDAQQVIPVFVTVDPQRDTPDHLREYVGSFDSRIRTLSQDAARDSMRAFRVRAERHDSGSEGGYALDHTAVLYVLDPQRRVIAALPESSATLDRDLVRTLHSHPGFPQSAPPVSPP